MVLLVCDPTSVIAVPSKARNCHDCLIHGLACACVVADLLSGDREIRDGKVVPYVPAQGTIVSSTLNNCVEHAQAEK